jgi:hypothetical protein
MRCPVVMRAASAPAWRCCRTLTALALSHGHDTAFWWIAGIFVGDAILSGILLRPGPLYRKGTLSRADGRVTTAQAHTVPVLA